MEKFIYQKKISLTKELCDEIIENYEEDYENRKYIFIVNKLDTEYELSYLSNNKIKDHLTNELNKNIIEYISSVNVNLFDNIKYHKFTMIIKKSFYIDNAYNNELDSSNIDIFKVKSRVATFTKKISTIAFIWFLTDFDDEIVFWDNYRIKPTTGTLILFPVSWCFPYKEIVSNNAQNYVIYGYISK